MTNDELKALCERVVETCERMRDIGLPLLIGDSAISLSQECLKLLAQCEAMRGGLESIINHHQHIKSVSNPHPALEALSETYYVRAKQALSHLGERSPKENK